jgi:hypothetical protein
MADVDVDIEVDAGDSDATLRGVNQGLGSLEQSSGRASGGLDTLANSASDVNTLMNAADQRADDLARAQNDVAQAALDVDQANRDLKQSQLDVNQADRDGAQAGIDLEQALLDKKTAQKEYNDAVKEFGPNSLEAQQAQIDLKQASEDAKQADADAKQAVEDKAQAIQDGKQAALDGKQAQLDLNQATRDAETISGPVGWLQWASQMSSVLFGLIGTFALVGTASIGAALTTAASWVAMAASSVAGAIAVAAAWLLSIWPIALIIAAIAGLVALVIIYWDDIKYWTIKIFGAVWTWLKDLWDDIVDLFFWAVDKVKTLFLNFTVLGIIIKNWGAISGWISNQWSGIASTISGWVGKIKGFFHGMWDGVVSGLKWALNGIIGLLNDGIYGVNVLISGANRIPGVNIGFIPYIPYLANGGVTTGPTLAMIGEGPEQEAVLPLSKLEAMINTGGGAAQAVSQVQPVTARVELDVVGGANAFTDFFREVVRTKAGGDVVKYAEG